MKSIYRILCLILALTLVMGVALTAISCDDGDDNTPCTSHVDNDGDGVCDSEGCDEPVEPDDVPCTSHTDSDGDGVCDTEGCDEPVEPAAPETVDHTLTLVDDNGDPVVGVSVSIVITGEEPAAYYTTDENGQVTVAVGKTMKRIIAVFEDGLVGYELPDDRDCKFGIDETALTIELVKLTAYTVRVLDASGAPVAGTAVQLCYGENCLAQTNTDENGEFTKYLNFDGAPKVKVFAISSDYIYFEEGETVLVVTIPDAE